jgi:hypothetical protein
MIEWEKRSFVMFESIPINFHSNKTSLLNCCYLELDTYLTTFDHFDMKGL